jgi:hypothetical protein
MCAACGIPPRLIFPSSSLLPFPWTRPAHSSLLSRCRCKRNRQSCSPPCRCAQSPSTWPPSARGTLVSLWHASARERDAHLRGGIPLAAEASIHATCADVRSPCARTPAKASDAREQIMIKSPRNHLGKGLRSDPIRSDPVRCTARGRSATLGTPCMEQMVTCPIHSDRLSY